MKYFVFSMVGWAVVLLVIFVFKPWDKKKPICDTCQHLIYKDKNKAWKYECKKPGYCSTTNFDKCPEICKHYLPKEDDESEAS